MGEKLDIAAGAIVLGKHNFRTGKHFTRHSRKKDKRCGPGKFKDAD